MGVSSALLPIIPAQLTNQPATVAILLGTSTDKHRGGGGGGGNGGGGGCGNGPKENCRSVPEGGSPFTYLGLAGLVCIGAIVYSRRTVPS